MTLASGTRLGSFEILGPLGAGGMGEVYRARDSRLGREVAIKVLPENLREDPERLGRFEREARAASRIADPHVVSVFDVGRDGRIAFLVTELVDGSDLRAELASGPLPVARAVEWAAQIAEGLAAAHECGVIHRDLKPENVLVTRSGTVKIADFGLAKLPEALTTEGPDARTLSTYSVPGVVMGTLGYMSPEQVRGEAADERSDVFSLGALAYELLSGRSPFGGGASADVIAAILREDPADLRVSCPSIPTALDRIVRHCLEKRPERRFQSARDLAFALRDLVVASEAATAPAALPSAGTTRSVLPLPPGTRLCGQEYPILAISRDGSKLAYVARSADGPPHLYVSHLDRGETQRVPKSEGARGPFFSPDGQWLAFASESPLETTTSIELRKFSFSSSLTQTVCSLPDFQGASWGEDGSIYFVGDVLEGLKAVPVEGGSERAVLPRFRVGGDEVRRCVGYPRLFDSDRRAIVLDWDASALGDTSLLDVATGALQPVAASGSTGHVVKTGHLLYLQTDGTLFATRLAPPGGRAGPGVAVLREVALDGVGGAFAVSDTGTLAWARGQISGSIYESRRIVRIDARGEVEPMGLPPEAFTSVRVSPDGRTLVVHSRLTGLWVCDLRRGGRVRLPAGSTRLARYPTWTRDGQWIVFRGATVGEMGYRLFRQRPDGSEPPELLFGADATERRPRGFTADGEVLLCEISGPESQRGLWGLSWTDPRKSERLLAASLDESRVSGDGRFLAFQSGELGSVEVFVQRLAEHARRVQVSVGGGRAPRWSPDGTRLYFAQSDRLLVAPLEETRGEPDFGAPELLFTRLGVEVFEPAPEAGGFVGIERHPDADGIRQLELTTGWFAELDRLAGT